MSMHAQMADLTIMPDGKLFLCNGAAKGALGCLPAVRMLQPQQASACSCRSMLLEQHRAVLCSAPSNCLQHGATSAACS